MANDDEELETGHAFTFKGPRRLLFFRAELAGVVIGTDPQVGVFHLMILDEPDGPALILHLPVLGSAIAATGAKVFDQQDVPEELVQPVLDAWRERHANGEVGAFGVPLHQAFDLVERTVAESGMRLGNLRPKHAYPKRDPATGEFRVVEVAGHDTPQET